MAGGIPQALGVDRFHPFPPPRTTGPGRRCRRLLGRGRLPDRWFSPCGADPPLPGWWSWDPGPAPRIPRWRKSFSDHSRRRFAPSCYCSLLSYSLVFHGLCPIIGSIPARRPAPLGPPRGNFSESAHRSGFWTLLGLWSRRRCTSLEKLLHFNQMDRSAGVIL